MMGFVTHGSVIASHRRGSCLLNGAPSLQPSLLGRRMDCLHQPSAIRMSPASIIEQGVSRAGKLFGLRPKLTTAIPALALGIVIGLLLGRVLASFKFRNLRRLTNASEVNTRNETSSSSQWEEGSFNPTWLNDAVARIWGLFQGNTKRLVKDVIQPVFNDSELPDFVTFVQVKSFEPGKQPPQIRNIRRMPSRSLSEVQYSFQSRFSSTSETNFDVHVSFNGFKFTVPVTTRNLDVDAIVWTAFKLAPYEPYCSAVEYALMETPAVSFDMEVAGVLPITAIPVLKKFFFRVITKEIPQELMLPRTIILDFTPEGIKERKHHAPVSSPQKNITDLTDEQLDQEFPEQRALFDATDLDGDGFLSKMEVSTTLKDWGYTVKDAAESFDFFDTNKDKSVSFREFCRAWPELEASFVPSRYKGVLTVFLDCASDIELPLVGRTDPYVTLRTSTGQVASSKLDSQTSESSGPGFPIWREAFELNCISPSEEILEVTVFEGSRLAVHGRRKEIGKASISLDILEKNPNQKMNVELEPQGSVRLDLSYANFVDKESFLPPESSDE